MQRDPPTFEDDLDLDETEDTRVHGSVGDDVPTDVPETSGEGDEVDVGDTDTDECEQETTHVCSSGPVGADDAEAAPTPEKSGSASDESCESQPDKRFDLRRIHESIQHWLDAKSARLSGVFPHPLVAVGVVMLVGGGIYEFSGSEEEDAKGLPPPRVAPGGFETPDFRRADKGSITERQAAATLAQHRAERGEGGDVSHQCASPSILGETDKTDPGGNVSNGRLFTAQQMRKAVAEARKRALEEAAGSTPQRSHRRRPSRQTMRAHRAVAIPPTVADEDSEASRSLPAYLVGFAEESKKAPEVPRLDLPVGTRILAVLDLGISSAKHGTAVARTTTEMVDASGRKIPTGSVLTGRSSSSNDRIYLDFTAIRVGTETFQLRGVGTENEDLGLLAERIESPMNERTASRLADGALGAVRGLAAAGGGMVGRAVSQATGGVINEAQREQSIDRTVTLKVAAGTSFVVVITG